MTRSEIDQSLKEIFVDIFDVSPDSLNPGTSPDTLLEWDSLAHVRLMAALEEQFGVVLSPESQVEMLNFELMGDVLSDLTAALQ